MPREKMHSLKSSQPKVFSPAKNEICVENVEEKENLMVAKAREKELDRLKSKNSKRKPFTCPVAVFEENEDPNKKCMYPKHLVYADGKDTSIEELRAMHYWNRIKGPVLVNNLGLCFNKPKTFRDMCTQTEPEPVKIVQVTETSTQTKSELIKNEEIAVVTESKPARPKKTSNQNNQIASASSRISTRSATRAKLGSKIPASSNLAKNVIKEESTIIPSSNSATFIVSKGENQDTNDSKKPTQSDGPINLHNGEHSNDEEELDDSMLNMKAFAVVPSSTPFEKNKQNKDRRKAVKLELPTPN